MELPPPSGAELLSKSVRFASITLPLSTCWPCEEVAVSFSAHSRSELWCAANTCVNVTWMAPPRTVARLPINLEPDTVTLAPPQTSIAPPSGALQSRMVHPRRWRAAASMLSAPAGWPITNVGAGVLLTRDRLDDAVSDAEMRVVDAQGAEEPQVGDVDTRGAARDGDETRICDVCRLDSGIGGAGDPYLRVGHRRSGMSVASDRRQ
eukprot:7266677-Prymnesium_polylepis.1